jgi:drug/metabolite transporter (DMT)-like permease
VGLRAGATGQCETVGRNLLLALAAAFLGTAAIADLLHRRTWLAGMGCVVLGYLLQAVAFGFAPVAFVEPVMGVEVVLALPLAARLRHRRLGQREWAGATGVVVGVGGFLALCDAAGGDPEPGLVRWALVAAPTLAAAVGGVVASRAARGTARPLLLAVAAGLSFALMALVTQSAVQQLSRAGIAGFLGSWQPYVLAVLGPVAFTVAQSAYQAGPLALSLPVLDSLEPVAAILLATVAFGQHLSVAPPRLAGEVACGTLAIAGIVLLARSPLVLAIYAQSEREQHRAHRAERASRANRGGANDSSRRRRAGGPAGAAPIGRRTDRAEMTG